MKRVLVSLSIIGLVAVIAITGTIAFFQDLETSAGNTFSAGSLDLKIRDQNEPYKDGVVGTWTAGNATPGDTWMFDVPFVGLYNVGTIKGNHLEITCDYSVIEEVPCLEPDTDCATNLEPDKMAREMIITRSIYRGTENGISFCINALTGKKYPSFHAAGRYCFGTVLAESLAWKIEDNDEDGRITFADLKLDKLNNLPAPNEETFYIMDVRFAETAGNNFQGDAFDLTMIFTLNQDASQ